MMKDKDFDDAIRKKLESLDQKYSDMEVEKVFQAINKPPGWSWGWLKSPWFIAPLSVAAMITVTCFTVFRNSREMIPQGVSNEVSMTNVIEQKNLVQKSDPAKLSKKEKNTTLAVVGASAKMVDNIEKDTVNSVNSSKNSANNELNSTSNSNVPKRDLTEDETKNVAVLEAETIKKGVIFPVKTNDTVLERKDFTFESMNEKPIYDTLKSLLIIIPDDQLVQVVRADTTTLLDSLIVDSTGKTMPIIDTNRFIPSPYRIMAIISISNASYSLGLTGEWLYGGHVGVRLGLKYNATYVDKIKNSEELLKRKYHHINNRIEKRMEENDHFSEVSINNRLIQIPVSLAYYVPTRKNMMLMVALGTDFDVYLYQQVTYSHQKGGMDKRRDQFKTNGKVVPFNSFILSAGVSTQWKQFTFQLQPFVSPQVKKVSYKRRDFEYGACFGVVYTFAK